MPYWSYTTVIADAPSLLETVPNRESSELRWVADGRGAHDLPLHPGFAASWQRLRDRVGGYSAVPASAAARRAALAPGSSAAVIARTTTTRVAPASITSGNRPSSMPPMANHGLAGASPAVARTRSRPGAVRPGLVGVGQHGPTQK